MNLVARAVPAWATVLLVAFLATFAPRPLRAQTPPVAVPATPATVAPAAVATGVERALLWRIEGPTPNYLFGTIHLPDDRVTKLVPVVRAAVDGCDALFTELPMELGEMMKMQARTQLPKGQTLADVLGPELYARVAAYVTGKGVKTAAIDRMQPWAVSMQLPMLDQMAKMMKMPLDMQLYEGARKAKKVVGGLETFEEQFAVFADLSIEEQRSLVASTLDSLEEDAREGMDTIEKLLQVYLRGDEQAIDKELNEYKMGDEALRAKLMQRLLGDRNLRMADRIVKHLQEQPGRSHLFAVGAAHYVGETGLLQLLTARGYRITRLDLNDPAAAKARDVEAIDAEIARRTAELEQLRARRERLQPVGSGRRATGAVRSDSASRPARRLPARAPRP
ncbi:MAG: TraB/GumN family protein [Planctomycetota bacterium]